MSAGLFLENRIALRGRELYLTPSFSIIYQYEKLSQKEGEYDGDCDITAIATI